MKVLHISFFYLIVVIFSSCSTTNRIVGLWQIESVKVGEQEMTPIARWTRLNENKTQESGNGWNQHSVGTWLYEPHQKTLNITNSNGFADPFGPFTLKEVTNETMMWSREEEGSLVEVSLRRISQIPRAPANRLLGVWKSNTKKDTSSFLFFRWDHIVMSRQDGSDRQYGMYKTHGHKQEVQIVHYEDPLRQTTWSYTFSDTGELLLNDTADDKSSTSTYRRIDYIPD